MAAGFAMNAALEEGELREYHRMGFLRRRRAASDYETQFLREAVRRLGELERRVEELQIQMSVSVESRLLTSAAAQVPKRPTVAFIEAPDQYGNVRALALACGERLGAEHVFVVAADATRSAEWEHRGIRSFVWDTGPGHAGEWLELLTSSVVVYEHHPFWRTNHELLRLAFTAGAAKVQLWHGSTPPITKDLALGVLSSLPGRWEFADLVTTSVDIDVLVCESRDEKVRREQFVARQVVKDVDFRLVGPLRRLAERHQSSEGRARVLVAPTFPETRAGAEDLSRRLDAYEEAGRVLGIDMELRHHPWTPDWVKARTGLARAPHGDVYAWLEQYDALITDYSSLASDALLLGRKVVLDLSYEDYERPVFRDERALSACTVVTNPLDAPAAALADPWLTAEARREHREARLRAIDGSPGEPTLRAIEALLR